MTFSRLLSSARVTGILALSSLWVNAPVLAEEAPAAPPAEAPPAAPAPEKPAPPAVSGKAGSGITLTSPDNKLSLTLKSRLSFRYGLDRDAEGELTDVAVPRTLRLYFTGHVLNPDIKYTTQLALGPGDYQGSNTPIFDAFVDFTHLPGAKVKVGQYFVPFDRARTNREFGLHTTERPIVVKELTLDRDVGISVGTDSIPGAKILGYQVGVFGGNGRNLLTNADLGYLTLARLELRPFGTFDDNEEGDPLRHETPKLLFGIAAAHNGNATLTRSTNGSALAAPVDYGHGAVDLVFKWHGLYILGEGLARVALSEQEVEEGAEGALARPGWGALVQVGYMVLPKLELAGRYNKLGALEGAEESWATGLTSKDQEVAAAVNYYVNGHKFKVQGDWVHIYGDVFSEGTDSVHLALDMTF